MRIILCPILRHLSAVCFLLSLALPVSAQDAKSDAVAREVTAVKQALEAKFPGAPIRNVSKSPYFGLFEAQLDDRMLYTDGKVNYVIVGSVYDTATRTNLTDQRMKRMNRIACDSLPLELAIKKVKGDGSRKPRCSARSTTSTRRRRWCSRMARSLPEHCLSTGSKPR